MTIHSVQLNERGAEQFLLAKHLLWDRIEPVDHESCLIFTQDDESDALTDSLDEDGIEWELH